MVFESAQSDIVIIFRYIFNKTLIFSFYWLFSFVFVDLFFTLAEFIPKTGYLNFLHQGGYLKLGLEALDSLFFFLPLAAGAAILVVFSRFQQRGELQAWRLSGGRNRLLFWGFLNAGLLFGAIFLFMLLNFSPWLNQRILERSERSPSHFWGNTTQRQAWFRFENDRVYLPALNAEQNQFKDVLIFSMTKEAKLKLFQSIERVYFSEETSHWMALNTLACDLFTNTCETFATRRFALTFDLRKASLLSMPPASIDFLKLGEIIKGRSELGWEKGSYVFERAKRIMCFFDYFFYLILILSFVFCLKSSLNLTRMLVAGGALFFVMIFIRKFAVYLSLRGEKYVLNDLYYFFLPQK